MQGFDIQPSDCAPYHFPYVQLVRDKNITLFLLKQGDQLSGMISSVPPEKGDTSYAPGKWTIKQVFQHVIDSERIFAYRLLALARGERQPIPGFEQDDYAGVVDVSRRTLSGQQREFESVRHATLTLVQSMSEKDLARRGTVNGYTVLAGALPYILAGHVEHHMDILRERYGL